MAIVTGLNLPMLIECAYASRLSMESAHEIANTYHREVSREGSRPSRIIVKPKKMKLEGGSIKSQSQAGAIPEGTVIGVMGHIIKYVLARVIHDYYGQVATTWTKTTQPTELLLYLIQYHAR